VLVANNTEEVIITQLNKFDLYDVRVLAFTGVGDGISSSPPLSVNTSEDGKLESH
jgi:hypothetical protein